LQVNGSIGSGAVAVHSGASLGGNGTIGGAVTVNSGGTLAPGAAALGTLTLGSSLSLGGTANFRLNKTEATLTSDQIAGATSITAGGTLNVTVSGDALVDGDTFTLFNVQPDGTFGSTPTLPSGANWWTTDNYRHITYNVWPTPTSPSMSHNSGIAVRIPIANLVSGAVSGKTMSVTSLGAPGVSGASVSSDSAFVYYTPGTTDANDSFTYTVSDGRGGSASGTVSLTVNSASVGQNAEISVSGGVATMKFYGLPGYQYAVQRAATVNGTYQDIVVNVTGGATKDDGLGYSVITVGAGPFTVQDPAAPGSSAFYQLRAVE
jgi:hypothetical protein